MVLSCDIVRMHMVHVAGRAWRAVSSDVRPALKRLQGEDAGLRGVVHRPHALALAPVAADLFPQISRFSVRCEGAIGLARAPRTAPHSSSSAQQKQHHSELAAQRCSSSARRPPGVRSGYLNLGRFHSPFAVHKSAIATRPDTGGRWPPCCPEGPTLEDWRCLRLR